jgi:hypothetical protein
VIFKSENSIYFSTYPPPTWIHLSHCFASASKHGSLWTVVTATSAPPSQPLRHQRNICHPVMNRFTRKILPILNRKHFFKNILCIESFFLQKTHNRTLLFGSTLFKHDRHFDYWNQLLNMSMSVCYLDYHEDGLCCFLMIHVGNILRPVQLFYLHLWPIYWLSLVHVYPKSTQCHNPKDHNPN